MSKSNNFKIRERFNRLKINIKILLYYLIILIFSIFLSSFLYQKIYTNIISTKVSQISLQTLYSISSNIDSLISNANNFSKVMITNNEFQEMLVKNLRAENNNDYIKNQRTVNSYLSKFVDSFPFISAAYVFDSNGYRYGVDKIQLKAAKNSDITETEWYKEAFKYKGGYIIRLDSSNGFFVPTGEKYISLIRIINDIYTQKPMGMLILNLSQEEFFQAYRDKDKYSTDIMIVDNDGNPVINFQNHYDFDFEGLAKKYKNESFSVVGDQGGKEYMLSHVKALNYDWNIYGVIPFSELSKDSNIFSVVTFIVIAFNSLMLLLGSLMASRMITKPIKKVLNAMKDLEKGKFDKMDLVATSDEMAKLRDGYNIMVTEIQNLIQRVVNDEKIKRKAELDVLQAQIKPHFLYNTFEAISSLALLGENKEVYALIKALGSFYRVSLNKGSEIITISEEVEVIRNYLLIQKARYGDIFTVSYDIDDRALKHKILKLTLQPLVENSLYHGIKLKGEQGNIHISIQCHPGAIIIGIEDDGVGMEAEEVADILLSGKTETNSKSFGLRGTIERLRIFYGVSNIVSIQSEKNVGTKITLTLPIKEEIPYAG